MSFNHKLFAEKFIYSFLLRTSDVSNRKLFDFILYFYFHNIKLQWLSKSWVWKALSCQVSFTY